MSGLVHPDQNVRNATQNSLCRAVNRRRGCCACRARNCRRRARFSQLYWHTTAPSYVPLQTVPENRVYVSPDRVDAFLRSFVAFSHGSVVSDEPRAPGVEVGRPAETYRRVRIESKFGKLTVLVTDGHLPYPYGREMTGYEVANLADTLTKAKASGVDVLVPPYKTNEREAVVVQFPGGCIAEIHSATKE